MLHCYEVQQTFLISDLFETTFNVGRVHAFDVRRVQSDEVM